MNFGLRLGNSNKLLGGPIGTEKKWQDFQAPDRISTSICLDVSQLSQATSGAAAGGVIPHGLGCGQGRSGVLPGLPPLIKVFAPRNLDWRGSPGREGTEIFLGKLVGVARATMTVFGAGFGMSLQPGRTIGSSKHVPC